MRQISVRITEENHKKIGELSKKSGIEYAQVLRNLLEAGIVADEDRKRNEMTQIILDRILSSVLFTEQSVMRMFDSKTVAPFDEKKRRDLGEIENIVMEIRKEILEKY